MAKARKSSALPDTSRVRAYLAALPPDARRVMKQLRAIIRGVAPRAVEEISYGIPAFRLDRRVFIYYAAWKHHTSVYPMGPAIRRAFASELKGYETSKGTVRFRLAEPLPTALVKRLVKARAAEVRNKKPIR